MTAAVDANAPAAQPKRYPYAYAGVCAFASVTAIGTGIMFTLLATGDMRTHRPQYPDEVMTEHAFGGIAYLAGLVTGVVAVRLGISAATNNS